MRAREFTINIPINIKINSDGEPEIDMGNSKEGDPEELDQNPVFVSPLQQEIELKKAEVGKQSAIIDKLTSPEDIGDEDKEEDEEQANIVRLAIPR
jgi:hypothetical protein